MVVWNTEISGLLNEQSANAFQGVVTALSPDIVLLNELLRDCASNGYPEENPNLADRARKADLDRLTQVSAVKKAVMEAVAHYQIDGVIIGGDFNLVGSRTPLDHLISLSPVGTGEMKVVRAMQLDGLSNTTWSDDKHDKPTFGPGRLDFVLRTESPFIVKHAFVFESADLSPEWLKHYGLNKFDSQLFSDHFPIVVDLAVDVEE